ncbi:MAG: SpaA isopeptide-forming pilin-related protein [Planctomycetota bacterium]|nr:SpaA isopeptide-forming pilin-related protein [Planctomycetota bacterium]
MTSPFRRRRKSSRSQRLPKPTCWLTFESLEQRQLLSTTSLAAITGQDLRETHPVVGALINLYQDAVAGTPKAFTSTDSSGHYRFDNVAAGNYYVQQPAQILNGVSLSQFISNMIPVSTTDVRGTPGVPIDKFAVAQSVFDPPKQGQVNASSQADSSALGGERDLIVKFKEGSAVSYVGIIVAPGVAPAPGQMSFGAFDNATGDYEVKWDGTNGQNGNPADLHPTGLRTNGQGVDLTNGSANGYFELKGNVQVGDGTATVLVYSDATHFSSTSGTFAVGSQDIILSWSDFLPGAGAAGKADFANVGAIVFTVSTSTPATQFRVDSFGPLGTKTITADINNVQMADLSVTDSSVDNLNPVPGQQVTINLKVKNSGPTDASNVKVTDILPSGLTFVSATPPNVYTGGVWTVGNVPVGTTAAELQIKATVSGAATIVNTAQISSSDQPDSNLPNNTKSFTLVPYVANLSLSQPAPGNTAPNVGQTVTLTVNVRNDGPLAATNVQVTDHLPPGLVFISTTLPNAYINGVWTVGSLAVNGTATLQIVALVTNAGALTNAASITAADQADTNAADNQSSVTLNAQQVDLSLKHEVDVATPNVGQKVNFKLTLHNTGPTTATNVKISDPLPTGLTFVSATASQGTTYDKVAGTWTLAAVPVSVDASLQIIATVTSADPRTVTARVTSVDQPGPTGGPVVQAGVTVTPQIADLALAFTPLIAQPNVGQQATFTLNLTNAGPDAATNVVVTDVLPAGLSFVSARPSPGTYDKDKGVWTVGTVARGATPTLQLTAKVDTPEPRTNTATISAADQYDPNSGAASNQASLTVTPPEADLQITKKVDNPAPNVNDTVTFTIVVSNAGPNGATNVVARDLLPKEFFTFVSSTITQGTYSPTTGDWTVGAVSNGDKATLTLVGKATVPGANHINAAQVTAADQYDSNPTNNQTSATLTTKTANLSLSMAVDNQHPNVNGHVIFTMDLANSGPDDATGVVVRDQLPVGLSIDQTDPSLGTYDQSTGHWTVGTLANGSKVRLTIQAKVIDATPKTNTAQVVETGVYNSTPASATASQTVTPKMAKLSLTNVVDNQAPNANAQVKYTITVANAGPDAATGVVVSAPLPLAPTVPDGLTFVSATLTPSTGTYDSATGQWNVGTVDPGSNGNATLVLVAQVTHAGTKTATAQITVSDVYPNSLPNNPSVPASVPLTPQVVNLAITSAVFPDPVYTGRKLTYTLKVTNAGPSDATGVTLTDTLPVHLDPDPTKTPAATSSQGDKPTVSGTVVTAKLGKIVAGAVATVTVDAWVDASYEGPLTNLVQVTSEQFSKDVAANTSTLASQAILPPSRIAGTVYLDFADKKVPDNDENGIQKIGPDGKPLYKYVPDGVQSANEPGIAGVLVTLSGQDRNNNPVSVPYWTGPDGKYEFTNLKPGTYTVVETQPTFFNPGTVPPGVPPENVDLNDPKHNTFFFDQLGSGVDAPGFNFGDILPVQVSRRNYWAWS